MGGRLGGGGDRRERGRKESRREEEGREEEGREEEGRYGRETRRKERDSQI